MTPRFGACLPHAEAEAAKAAGFGYIEMSLSSIAAMDEAAYRDARAHLVKHHISAEAFNVFMPGSYRVTGPDANHPIALEYARAALPRAAAMGCKVAVFGSAGARNMPDGFDKEAALDQLEVFFREAGVIARDNGITICIEPLNKRESNIINTLADGLVMVKRVDDNNVRLLADLYHMHENGEDMGVIRDTKGYLKHCHIANPVGRLYPKSGDSYDLKPFFDALKAIGYEGRVSVEGKAEGGVGDYPLAVEAMKAAIG